jgi:hypothetical protein
MENNIVTTKYKIGKITYIVNASSSEKATDTLPQKIEKLIIKELKKNTGKPGISSNFIQ